MGPIGRKAGVGAAMLLSISLFTAGCGLLNTAKEDNSLLIAGTKQFSGYSSLFQTEFTKSHKHTMVVIQEGDTTPGILALRNGAIDVAIASRDLNENEDDKWTQSHLAAKDAIHLIVHPGNPVADLTIAQLKSILTGKADNWKQLGGPDMPIALIFTGTASDTYGGLSDLVMDGEAMAAKAATQATGKEVVDAVAADKQAVGIVATKDLDIKVKALTVNNVEANRTTIYSGRYPLTRSIYFVVRSEPSELTRKFVDFVLGKDGQALLQKEGALPLH
ncbi:phosphate ABC transporter substrate-binding protein [Paenibacillus sp. GCM10012303]|uniref:phosphate ABC transporter substrate-binding protein n=1 Tax=Paenibacillus sp. GCM10012303 TaxID=3317340 RepID=UPI00361F34B4